MAKMSVVCYPDIYSIISVRYRYEFNLRTLKNVWIIETYLSSRSILHVEFLYTFPINHLSMDQRRLLYKLLTSMASKLHILT